MTACGPQMNCRRSGSLQHTREPCAVLQQTLRPPRASTCPAQKAGAQAALGRTCAASPLRRPRAAATRAGASRPPWRRCAAAALHPCASRQAGKPTPRLTGADALAPARGRPMAITPQQHTPAWDHAALGAAHETLEMLQSSTHTQQRSHSKPRRKAPLVTALVIAEAANWHSAQKASAVQCQTVKGYFSMSINQVNSVPAHCSSPLAAGRGAPAAWLCQVNSPCKPQLQYSWTACNIGSSSPEPSAPSASASAAGALWRRVLSRAAPALAHTPPRCRCGPTAPC